MYDPPKSVVTISLGIVGAMMIVVGAVELEGYMNLVVLAGFSLVLAARIM
jgi:hypothetical protein